MVCDVVIVAATLLAPQALQQPLLAMQEEGGFV